MLTRLDCPIIFFPQKDKIKGRGLMWCTCHALSLSLRISLSQTERSSPQQSIADPGWRSDQNREKKCTNLMGPVRKSSLKMVLYHKPSREKKYRLLATSLSRPPYFWDLSRFVFRHEGQYLCRVAWFKVGYIVSLHHESFANCVPKFFVLFFGEFFVFVWSILYVKVP